MVVSSTTELITKALVSTCGALTAEMCLMILALDMLAR